MPPPLSRAGMPVPLIRRQKSARASENFREDHGLPLRRTVGKQGSDRTAVRTPPRAGFPFLRGESRRKPRLFFVRLTPLLEQLFPRSLRLPGWCSFFQGCELLHHFDKGRWRSFPVNDRRRFAGRQPERLHQFPEWILRRRRGMPPGSGLRGRLCVDVAPGFLPRLMRLPSPEFRLLALLLGFLHDPVHQADKPDDDENDELFHGGTEGYRASAEPRSEPAMDSRICESD